MFVVRRLCLVAFALSLLLAVAPPAGAELQNHGPYGEYFHDTVTGLYWFDPCAFHDQARITVDFLDAYSSVWSWAAQSEVEALMGQTAEAGSSLEDVMGLRRSTITGGGPRWLGFYFGSGDDGWLVQSDAGPEFATVTTTGPQASAYSLGAGAWFVSAVDPVTATAVLEDDGAYFHDQSTDLYWMDPAEFAGYPRDGVVDWLSANTDWRWATQDEVFGLLGKTAVDGAPIEDVLGARQMTPTSGGPRWVGFYTLNGIVNGLLLQADIEPDFVIVSTGSTQANAGAFDAGAWLVSDIDPTSDEDASWGDVKRDFR